MGSGSEQMALSSDVTPATGQDHGRVVPAPPDSIDAGVPWHFGDPHREQRMLVAGRGAVDLSHRGVITVTGPDRLSWLHDLTTAHLVDLAAGASALALILDPRGRVEHELHLTDDGSTTWITTEPSNVSSLVEYLDSMKFMLRVLLADVSDRFAVVWIPERTVDPQWPTVLIAPEFAGAGVTASGQDRGGDASGYVLKRPADLVGAEVIVPRSQYRAYLESRGEPAGTWALEALRVGAAVPRLGFETDDRTLPHEVGWIGSAVHLSKGCYRGQETVARVHNLGQPPRRLVLLHLDGSAESLPVHGDHVMFGDRVVGEVGSAARHYELGPIATSVIKRSVPTDAELVVLCSADGTHVAASQQQVVTAGQRRG
ncbi:MAG: folate-binding protein [Actinomycetes bacterium]